MCVLGLMWWCFLGGGGRLCGVRCGHEKSRREEITGEKIRAKVQIPVSRLVFSMKLDLKMLLS